MHNDNQLPPPPFSGLEGRREGTHLYMEKFITSLFKTLDTLLIGLTKFILNKKSKARWVTLGVAVLFVVYYVPVLFFISCMYIGFFAGTQFFNSLDKDD